MGNPLDSCVKLSLIALSCWGGGVLADNDNEVTVGSVEGLVAELASCDGTTPKTIILQAGDYQLTSAQQTTDNTWGVSHLIVPGYVTLKGSGANPEATRLIGDGETGRVMCMLAYSTLENLTVTNGITTASKDEPSRGAAVATGKECVITNCVLIGNHAQGGGGGVASVSRENGVRIYHSKILNNTGSTGGGAHYVRCWKTLIAGNSSRTGEGGGGYAVILADCVVSNNFTVSNKRGGGLCDSRATGTLFVRNKANGRGGAVACSEDTGYSGVYSNCVFSCNSGAAGGAASNVILIDCQIACNYSSGNGGGVYMCSNVNCTVYDNFAKTYGGGVYMGVAYGTVISNNFSKNTGHNCRDSDLYDCEIIGMSAANGSATRCIFKGIGQTQSLTANPYWSTNQASTYAYYDYPNATNCLFVENRFISTSSSLLCGVQDAKKSSSVVNCTIVSNSYNYLARYFRKTDFPLLIQNTVITDNEKYDRSSFRDIYIVTSGDNRCDVGALIFDHCVYKTKLSSLDMTDYVCDNTLYRFGEGNFASDPGFMLGDDVENPFSLKRSSPLRGKGRVCDWMAESVDLLGNRRIFDEKVDIGCYQSLYRPGARIIVR